jgi:hypothetical protein
MEGKVNAMCCEDLGVREGIGEGVGKGMFDVKTSLPQARWWCGRLS